jgi:hypothetical protein
MKRQRTEDNGQAQRHQGTEEGIREKVSPDYTDPPAIADITQLVVLRCG